MCTNYRPGSRDYLRNQLGVAADFDYVAETYPAYRAPIVTRAAQGRRCLSAGFGLIPPWARDAKIARSTYNARSETVAAKPSFRHAWGAAQFCLVPMQCFYEPSYASGRALRWRIEAADGEPFCAAGIWECWRDPHGAELFTFSLLTINADGHALMGAFHAPDDEKRSIVLLAPQDHEAWLQADPQRAPQLLRPFAAADFVAAPDPRPVAAKSAPR